jgi:hypothetical protein
MGVTICRDPSRGLGLLDFAVTRITKLQTEITLASEPCQQAGKRPKESSNYWQSEHNS